MKLAAPRQVNASLWFIHDSKIAERYLIVIACCAILFGLVFRLAQLPTRTLFFDEAYTQMRVAGHTDSDMWGTLYDGRSRAISTIRHDWTVDSSSSPGLLIGSLIKEDAQHPPLFYLCEFLVVKVLGNSLLIWRLLPALFGILSIGAAYQLARELFVNRSAALLAAAVFAVSPIERIYSDQAREYSLFVLIVLLASNAMVHAARRNTFRSWAFYTLLAIAGLYASPFMAYVIGAHLVFLVGVRRLNSPSTTLSFFAAALCALAAYIPWLIIITTHRSIIEKTNRWSADHWPLARLAAKWVFNTGSTFFDLEYIDLRWSVIFAGIAIIAGVAVVRGYRTASREARWFLGASILVPAVLLATPDILLGEHRSSVARYALPAFAMLSILAARGLVNRPLLASILFGGGLCSSAVGLLHPSWWDNDRNADDARIAAIINSVPDAQVISEIPPASVVTFGRLLNPNVRLSLDGSLNNVQFSPEKPVFVLRSADSDVRSLEKRTGIRFARVAFVPTPTAHEIGGQIGSIAINEDQIVDLYRAVTGSLRVH